MKKLYGIIIFLIIVIIAMGISFYIYINKTTDSKRENIQNNNQEKTVDEPQKKDDPEMLDGPGYEYNEEDRFKGYTSDEWVNMIDNFYGNYEGIQVSEIICKYDENNNYTATVATEYEVCAEFVFDNKTSYAIDKNTGVTIDFINGKIITKIKNEEEIFFDNICLAVGFVQHTTEEEFIIKYFDNNYIYNSITRYDFRSEIERQSQYDEKFVIIPKDDDVKISLYECFFDEDGELYTRGALIENTSEPFTLLYDNFESTTPQICIKFEYNGYEAMFTLVFSGYDGKLDLTGVETEVLDISIY